MARASLIAALLAVVLAGPAVAGDPTHPLQVDLSLTLPTGRAGSVRSLVPIEQGDATIRTVARNQRNGETVVVDLTLDYRVPRGTIALDELVERIEIETATGAGELFQQAILDTQLITLNPNRAKLLYRATLFHPTDGQSYLLRVRLFGNYE